jgi:hypothetical protein
MKKKIKREHFQFDPLKKNLISLTIPEYTIHSDLRKRNHTNHCMTFSTPQLKITNYRMGEGTEFPEISTRYANFTQQQIIPRILARNYPKNHATGKQYGLNSVFILPTQVLYSIKMIMRKQGLYLTLYL